MEKGAFPIVTFVGAEHRSSGTETLSPHGPSLDKLADYLFRNRNIIGELKCLTADQTAAMNLKVEQLVRAWVQKNKKPPTQEFLSIATAPAEIQTPWLNYLRTHVENFVRKANRQIRSTKGLYGLPTAKGLLLVFNQSNPLHNNPKDFRQLLVSVLRKRKTSGERAFPHIHGAVYFPFETIKSHDQNMNFWTPLQLKTGPEEDAEPMRQFQEDMQQAWYAYLHKTTGRTIRQFKGE